MAHYCVNGSLVLKPSLHCPHAFGANSLRPFPRHTTAVRAHNRAGSDEAIYPRRGLLAASMLLLAPLGRPCRADGTDTRSLGVEELKAVLMRDFQDRQYYITGQITPSVFAVDCVFVDPTTRVTSPSTYSKAVASLFDPSVSRADLISAEVVDSNTLRFRWRFDATLRNPLRLKFKPYTGTTIYRTNAQGLVQEHLETWDISAADAFISAFFPRFGAPPAPPVESLPL